MNCENRFCMFWNPTHDCSLAQASINRYGMCDTFFYVRIEEEELALYRAETRLEYESFMERVSDKIECAIKARPTE